jgi:hypothetical protein
MHCHSGIQRYDFYSPLRRFKNDHHLSSPPPAMPLTPLTCRKRFSTSGLLLKYKPLAPIAEAPSAALKIKEIYLSPELGILLATMQNESHGPHAR